MSFLFLLLFLPPTDFTVTAKLHVDARWNLSIPCAHPHLHSALVFMNACVYSHLYTTHSLLGSKVQTRITIRHMGKVKIFPWERLGMALFQTLVIKGRFRKKDIYKPQKVRINHQLKRGRRSHPGKRNNRCGVTFQKQRRAWHSDGKERFF